MKDKNGISYTPLTKRQREVFENRLNEMEDRLVKASLDLANNEICLSEYMAITDGNTAMVAGMSFVLARLGWKHDKRGRKLVRRNMGYEDLIEK